MFLGLLNNVISLTDTKKISGLSHEIYLFLCCPYCTISQKEKNKDKLLTTIEESYFVHLSFFFLHMSIK